MTSFLNPKSQLGVVTKVCSGQFISRAIVHQTLYFMKVCVFVSLSRLSLPSAIASGGHSTVVNAGHTTDHSGPFGVGITAAWN